MTEKQILSNAALIIREFTKGKCYLTPEGESILYKILKEKKNNKR